MEYSNKERKLLTILNEFSGAVLDKDNAICQSVLDRFFLVISDFYFEYLTRGIVGLDYKNTKFENSYTKKYFEFGFTCLAEGVNRLVLEAVLSYWALLLSNNTYISHQELFEIKLLERLLLIMQQGDVKDYLAILLQLCSPSVYNEIEPKFAQCI